MDINERDKWLYEQLIRVTNLEAQYGINGDTSDLDSIEDKIREGLTSDERDEIRKQLLIRIERLEEVSRKSSSENENEHNL